MKVLVTDQRHASIEEERKVLEPFNLEVVSAFSKNEQELIHNGKDAVGFLVSYALITRKVMEALPELRVIVRYGAGVDNIDVAAARKLGKRVVSVPDYCTEEASVQTVSLTLTALRKTCYFASEVKRNNWLKDPSSELIFRFSNVDVGIIGFGRIGRKYASYIENMVSRIFFYDPYVQASDLDHREYFQTKTLEELVSQVRIVSIHVPLTEETAEMIDWALLSRARGIIIVNTSRSGIVKRLDVERALERKKVIFYAADVFWEEPPDFGDPWQRSFISRKDVLITPHTAWYSAESEKDLRIRAAEELLKEIQNVDFRAYRKSKGNPHGYLPFL